MPVSGPADDSTSPGATAVAGLRAASESADADALAKLLAPDIVFHSPLPSLATLFAVLPSRVSARRRGRVWGMLAAVLTRPLAFALRTADRFVPRFV